MSRKKAPPENPMLRKLPFVLAAAVVMIVLAATPRDAFAAPEVRAVDRRGNDGGPFLLYTSPPSRPIALVRCPGQYVDTARIWNGRPDRWACGGGDRSGIEILGYVERQYDYDDCSERGQVGIQLSSGTLATHYSQDFFIGCGYRAPTTPRVTANLQGATCDTSCTGLCGADCNGILGTEIYTNECAQHDSCVKNNGCNRFAWECTGDAVLAAISWGGQTAVHVIVAILDDVASFFGW